MNKININKLGIAIGSTFALLNLACLISILTLGQERMVFVFNTISHMVDLTPLIKTSISFSGVVIGLIEVFVIGWLIGITIASIYNAQISEKSTLSK